tara:strand:+ start:146 stop:442 length:297 start_codon:yes stop_codon:yes gene_type:complete
MIQVLDLLTTEDLCTMFDKSPLTIIAWRENKNLPHVIIDGDKRGAVRFTLPEVVAWAEEYGKPIVSMPERATSVNSENMAKFKEFLRPLRKTLKADVA